MKYRSAIIAATTLISTVWASNAYEPTWLPDGEEVKKAVAARRGKTELSKLALSMEPGTWAKLKTEMPDRLWSSPRAQSPSGKGRDWGGLHIGTWSDDAHWDSRTGQFLFFGVRKTRKFVAYSEEENKWRVIEFVGKENAPGLYQKFGHQYSCNAFDPVNSIFFTLNSRYDVVNDTWQPLIEGEKPGRGPMTLAYSVALKGLLAPTKKGKMQFFSDAQRTWTELGPSHAHGYHGVARDNPFRQEVLFMAGNNSEAVAIVDKDGKIHPMKDYPHSCGIRHNIITVDPQSGRYLIMDPRHPKFYEFDPDLNEYRLLDDFSKTPYPGQLLAAYIPEYGVSMWTGGSGVHLYKHNPDGVAPKLAPEAIAKKLSWNSAIAGGDVSEGSPIPETFICINPGRDAGTGSTNEWARVIPMDLQAGEYSLIIDGLKSQQEYFVRAYALNYVGDDWSEARSFTTDPAPPKVAQLTIDGDQQIDGEAPFIAFKETPDHPLYAVGESPDWLYTFADYGARPTPLHLGAHKFFSDQERGKLILDLNAGAIFGKGDLAILTFRSENRSSAHITIRNAGVIDIGGIDTHAEHNRSNSDYRAGHIRIGAPDQRAKAMRIGYLHAYATGARAGSADITVYGSGDVTIGTSKTPGEIRTDTKAWNGSDIVVDHLGNLTVGAIKTRTEGWRGGSHPGCITLNGNNSSGDAKIDRIVAWNSRSRVGKSRPDPMTIANYRNVILGDIDGSYTGDGRRPMADLNIDTGITGNIVVTGKLDLGSTYEHKDPQNAKQRGAARLVCKGTVGVARLDLDRVRYILMDSGSGTSVIKGKLANFDVGEASGAGTKNDPKISKETRLRAPAGQTVSYGYKKGGVNDALGGHVWQLRGKDGKEPGGLLMPRP
ncbi:MAG: hypothetical protein ACOCVH_01775 [Verrucomicrobiota bacterium]